jgi:hypothetical protein
MPKQQQICLLHKRGLSPLIKTYRYMSMVSKSAFTALTKKRTTEFSFIGFIDTPLRPLY